LHKNFSNAIIGLIELKSRKIAEYRHEHGIGEKKNYKNVYKKIELFLKKIKKNVLYIRNKFDICIKY